MGSAPQIAAPLVGGRVFRIVDGSKGKFVQPSGHLALRIDVTRRLTGAHGQTQNCVLSKRHGSRQGGDVAVVDDLEGNVPFLSEIAEHWFYLFIKNIVWHTAKKGGDAWLILHVHPGGTATNGFDLRQVTRRLFQGIRDSRVMISRVFLIVRIPCSFLTENNFAIDHRRHLAIASSKIEANTATVEVSPQLASGILLGR